VTCLHGQGLDEPTWDDHRPAITMPTQTEKKSKGAKGAFGVPGISRGRSQISITIGHPRNTEARSPVSGFVFGDMSSSSSRKKKLGLPKNPGLQPPLSYSVA